MYFGIFFLMLMFGATSTVPPDTPEWGFFGHRRINRLAVYTLPPGMMAFFKPHIDWISDHAVDADMRRYASPFEAPRHYIDLDRYGTPPFDSLPRHWTDALLRHTDIYAMQGGDTVMLIRGGHLGPDTLFAAYRRYFQEQIVRRVPGRDFRLDPDSLLPFCATAGQYNAVYFREHLTEHGIVPWHLQRLQRELTDAFRKKQGRRILRICADMGHYLADAHVPLHTTSNYNGQKTGQHGIHAFWESRLPELFADEQYDFFVGPPTYLERPDVFFWEVVLESHRLVDSVLSMELHLREVTPPDRQFCPEIKNGRAITTACPEYAADYQRLLNGMVERRMRAAVHAVASAWYTAWIDAGQPNLQNADATPSLEEMASDSILLKTFRENREKTGIPGHFEH